MRSFFRGHWFVCLVGVYLCYALAFIYNSSVIVDGKRYFVLLDDAMISMTYARNLAQGHGAVWYPGAEPVQGYSNPLWMLLMALVHCFPLSPAMTSLPVQLMGAALMAGTLVFVKRIAERLVAESAPNVPARPGRGQRAAEPAALAPFLAVLLTAFYLPLNNWSLRGMEVGAVAFGISLAVWAALRCADGKSYQWWLLPLLGVLTTIRMDALVAAVVILAWLLWAVPQQRLFTLVLGAGSLAFFILLQLVIQKTYYHDWLPNTYYLKLENIPLARRIVWGAYVLLSFCTGFGLWLFAAAVLYAAAVPSKTVMLLVAIITGQVAYSVYVGGDSWEWAGGANRFLSAALPLLFILVAASFVKFRELLARAGTNISAAWGNALIVAIGLLALIDVNSYQFYVDSSIAQTMLLMKLPQLDEHRDMVQVAVDIQKVATPQTRIALTWGGAIPYFSERQPIDLLGKCDRRIAHGPNNPLEPAPLPFFTRAPVPYCWPGHTKRDYNYSIMELKPDVIQKWWGMDSPEIRQFLDQHYVLVQSRVDLYVKKETTEFQQPN